jgi:hypothetical protein
MAHISMGSLRQATLACAVFVFADRAVRVCAVVNTISARGIVSIKSLHPAALALAPLLQESGRWPDEVGARARVDPPPGPASSVVVAPEWGAVATFRYSCQAGAESSVVNSRRDSLGSEGEHDEQGRARSND